MKHIDFVSLWSVTCSTTSAPLFWLRTTTHPFVNCVSRQGGGNACENEGLCGRARLRLKHTVGESVERERERVTQGPNQVEPSWLAGWQSMASTVTTYRRLHVQKQYLYTLSSACWCESQPAKTLTGGCGLVESRFWREERKVAYLD